MIVIVASFLSLTAPCFSNASASVMRVTSTVAIHQGLETRAIAKVLRCSDAHVLGSLHFASLWAVHEVQGVFWIGRCQRSLLHMRYNGGRVDVPDKSCEVVRCAKVLAVPDVEGFPADSIQSLGRVGDKFAKAVRVAIPTKGSHAFSLATFVGCLAVHRVLLVAVLVLTEVVRAEQELVIELALPEHPHGIDIVQELAV